MKKRTDILYLSNPDERVEHRKLSRLAHFIRFGIQILFILFPNSRKHTNDSGFYWRRVQDSNLWTAINRHGLASRCITTLPTLQNSHVKLPYATHISKIHTRNIHNKNTQILYQFRSFYSLFTSFYSKTI